MKLDLGEIVLTAYAEYASGPGWANSPIWVVIRSPTRGLRIDCLQPEEQTLRMRWIYKIAATTQEIMLAELSNYGR